MHITAVEIRDVMRIRHVKLTPDADRSLFLIGGANAQGKTSILRALSAAFGGKAELPGDPVRHDADFGEIVVRLDEDEIEIRRDVWPNGDSKLEVRSKHGKISSPQAFLDKLVGKRFMDPLAFLQLAPAAQRQTLLGLIPEAGKLDDLERSRKANYEKRTECGRDLRKAKAALEQHGPRREVDAQIDVAALLAERDRFAVQQRAGDGLGHAHREAQNERMAAEEAVKRCTKGIEDIDKQIAELQRKRAALADDLTNWATDVQRCREIEAAKLTALETARDEWRALQPRREQIDAELSKANEHNKAAHAAQAANDRRAQLARDVERYQDLHDKLDKLISEIEASKAHMLKEARFPVPGLGFDDDGPTLNGIPLAQASGAERWRVALSLAVALRQDLHDVWIRDGALLDDDALRALGEFASANKIRIWVEVVGQRPGAVVIHDGKIAENGVNGTATTAQGELFR